MLQEGMHQWNITTNASGLFQDGIGGYDWSFQVEEGITNFALMPIHPKGNPQYTLQNQVIFDSGCSRQMTGNKFFLTDYQEIDGGFVAFRGSTKGGIKREFSVARTPQQNGVAERKNKTLIEAAKTMLADSLLPTNFS
ncbi:retrovirus-related pol polyprotein from transposon TNT 1-94 [Tanacetum coccineum]|uniref:Retrovirus-related pol polyprotein from transposon TNT 1-94 n=1 Tax=Tanacetum coccineum TaxID=301880 RepID=A0ABQ4Z409_9ASTR